MNIQFNTQRLLSEEDNDQNTVTFSIDNGDLDSLLIANFARALDYKEADNGDTNYVLPHGDYDRFIDLAMSSGFDVDQDIDENPTGFDYDELEEEGSTTSAVPGIPAKLGANLAGNGWTSAPSKKNRPSKGGFIYKDLWEGEGDNKNFLSKLKNLGNLDQEEKTQVLSRVHNLPNGAIKPSFKKERHGYSVKYTHPKTGSLMTGFLNQSRIDNFLNGTIKLKEADEPTKKISLDNYLNKVGLTKEQIKHIKSLYSDRSKGDHSIRIQLAKLVGADKAIQIQKWYSNDGYINENYSKFRKETKTRNEAQQYHEAIKLAHKKIDEVNKILEYSKRVREEFPYQNTGMHETKSVTKKAIDKLKLKIAESYKKIKKLEL
jgi:hypothetical protein